MGGQSHWTGWAKTKKPLAQERRGKEANRVPQGAGTWAEKASLWSRKRVPRRCRKSKLKTVVEVPVRQAPPRGGNWCALAVFVVVLVVYLVTIIPTAVDEDSGELVAAAHVLGIAHPTGYPLWTLLARAFDFLPVGHTSAYRVALLSAVSAAAAAALIAWLTSMLTGTPLPGLFAGLCFGLWFPTWSQAVLAEVYTLGGLLFALFALAFWRWDQTRSPRSLGWAALAGGFASMHHRTAFLAMLPALWVAFWLTRPRRARVWARALGLAVTPFLLYLYLPIRALARPPMNWGNPDTLERFLYHAMGGQYRRWALASSWEEALAQGRRLLGEAMAGPGWPSLALVLIGLPLIAWGFVFWWRRRWPVVGALATGSLLLSIWVLGWGETSDLKVFLEPIGLVLALLGGMGMARLGAALPRRKAGQWLAVALGAVLCALLLGANWERSDRSQTWRHRDHWAAALAQMDRNALFVAEFDVAMFVTHYLQHVEGFRKDITLIAPHQLWHPWYVALLPDRELRDFSDQQWKQLTTELRIPDSESREFWQGVSVFAHRLAQHYRGRRTVYAIHAPLDPIPGPPSFTGLSRDVVKLDFADPDPRCAVGKEGAPLAQFQGGVRLMSFDLGLLEGGRGETLGFRARWRLDSPLPGALFAVKLVPAAERVSEGFLSRGEYLQEFAPIYGLWGLSASLPGTGYEQKGQLILPSNAPPGEYRLQIGFATEYPPPKYEHWTELPARLRVRPGPLPTNGP